MEWAIGKGYDLFREGTGKLILPGEKISWDQHLHAVGEEITAGSEIGIWFYPKGQEPKKRSYLIGVHRPAEAASSSTSRRTRSPHTEGFTVLKENTLITNFQPHFHLRGKAMQVEAILPDGSTQIVSYVGKFNFNWMTNYIYADDAAPVFPKGTVIHVSAWYDNTQGEQEQPRSGSVGRLRRSHGRRDGARLDERRLPDRRRIQGAGRASARRRPPERPQQQSDASDPQPRRRRRRRQRAGLGAASATLAAQQLPSEPRGSSARASPARSKAGSTTPTAAARFLVGYLNRNIDAGARRPDRPEQPDRAGRARHGSADALPARPADWGMFIVTVPKDFTPTSASPGRSSPTARRTTIPLRLNPDYIVSPFNDVAVRNTPPVSALRWSSGADDSGPDRDASTTAIARTTSLSLRRSRCRSGRRTTRSTRAARTRRCAIRRRRCELTGRSTAARATSTFDKPKPPVEKIAGGGGTPVQRQGDGDREVQRAGRLRAARHRERLLGRRRRRRGVLLDDRDGEGHRYAVALHSHLLPTSTFDLTLHLFGGCACGCAARGHDRGRASAPSARRETSRARSAPRRPPIPRRPACARPRADRPTTAVAGSRATSSRCASAGEHELADAPAVPSLAERRQLRQRARILRSGSSAGHCTASSPSACSRMRRDGLAIRQGEVHHQVGARQERLVHRVDEIGRRDEQHRRQVLARSRRCRAAPRRSRDARPPDWPRTTPLERRTAKLSTSSISTTVNGRRAAISGIGLGQQPRDVALALAEHVARETRAD